MNFKIANKKQFFIGLISLILGIVFYFSFRPNMSSYFQKKLMKIDILFGNYSNLFCQLGGFLPEFIHPFGFSLLCMGLISKTRKSKLLICIIFFSINIFFEFGQKYNTFIVRYIPAWFNQFFLLENTKDYFILGTFTPLDLIAISLGSIMAFFIAEVIS